MLRTSIMASQRQNSINDGLTRYFTGIPCLNGHLSERMTSTKTCIACKNEREKTRKKRKTSQDQLYKKMLQEREKRKADPEKFRKISLQNYYKHKEKRLIYSYTYLKNRLQNDPLFAFRHNISSMISQAFRIKSYSKKSRTFEIIGCTKDELILHFEKQFLPKMGWQNRSDWHIDHIVPLSSASTEQDLINLNHFTNLRPIWAKENLLKSSKMEFLI